MWLGHVRNGVLDLRQRDALLTLVLPAAIAVGSLADVIRVGLEEDHLRDSLIGVNLGRQRRGVGKFERDEAFPFRLERRDVDDDAATRIRRLAQTNPRNRR